ncbi:hypothetical protein ACFVU3_28730 [Streptomyces sp. NPDC058052]|uniref:hypothetical protein n=1 Tax=Streptomyces sp. NPDC058052 TaxID=3346316 RepID=UPI0036E3A3D2
MSPTDLAGAVVAALASGAASGAGTAAFTRLADLVRTRLGRSDEGRGALGLWDAEPGSDQAVQAVRARLTVELEGDPALAEQLRAALQAGPPPVPAHPPTITQRVHIGGNAHHATINVGPLHLKKTTGAVVTLAVIGVVLALLVVLGLRSVVQLLGDGEGERKVAALSELTTVTSVLPGRNSLPAEFKSQGEPVTKTGEQECRPECEGLLFTAETTMERERPQKTAVFYVAAFDSAPRAAKEFEKIRSDLAESSEKALLSFPPMGDTSTAYQSYPGENGFNEDDESIVEAEAGVLVGTVIVFVRYTTAAGDLEPSLTTLGRMMADRAQQAQNGNTPSATALL